LAVGKRYKSPDQFNTRLRYFSTNPCFKIYFTEKFFAKAGRVKMKGFGWGLGYRSEIVDTE